MTNEQLVTLIKSGEDVANNMLQLWKQNEAFIGKAAMIYSGYAEIEDLKQEGYIGLCNAVEHYDSDKDVPFINYAAFWIKAGMRTYVSNCTGAIRIPVNVRNEVQQYKKIVSEYEKWYGRYPSDWEMAGFMGVSIQKLELIKKNVFTSNIQSLNEPIGREDEDILLGDTIALSYNLEEDVIKGIDTATMKRDLWNAVDELPDDMPEIIRSRYQRNKTLVKIGEEFGISRGKVRQKEEKSLRILRWERPELRRYYDQYITSAPVLHVGLREFNRTWTSSVEKAVLYR